MISKSTSFDMTFPRRYLHSPRQPSLSEAKTRGTHPPVITIWLPRCILSSCSLTKRSMLSTSDLGMLHEE